MLKDVILILLIISSFKGLLGLSLNLLARAKRNVFVIVSWATEIHYNKQTEFLGNCIHMVGIGQ
jgi:hypothetical protein